MWIYIYRTQEGLGIRGAIEELPLCLKMNTN